MKALLSTIFAKVRGEAAFLVLLLVGAVGAFMYAELRQVRADRDALEHSVEVICAGAGTGFEASSTTETDGKGKPLTVAHARGALCQRQVAMLATFKTATAEATAATLAQALKDHDANQTTDVAAANAWAAAAKSANQRMEAADAEAERKNLVDREWFAAVNGVAGLRPSGG